MRILLNASNVIGTGARVVVRNILSTIPSVASDEMFDDSAPRIRPTRLYPISTM